MLRVRGLTRAGLVPVTFDLPQGECVAVMGPSGAGKSLLLRAIADLDPNEGEVTLDGESRNAVPAPVWRRRITYVAAESGWWADRVGDHMPDVEEAVPLIEALGLPSTSMNWPVSRLSTGEKQRLSLVRAFSLSPQVLLLDEPTAPLDADAVKLVEDLVARRRETGTSFLIVTHDTDQAARLATRSLWVENGQVEERAI